MDKLSNYIDDKNFIQWVFDPNDELEQWWNQFRIDNPEEKRNIELARKVLLRFRTKDKSLSEEEKIRLFSQILSRIEQKSKSRNTVSMVLGLMKYAAVALVFFAIGALLFYKENTTNPAFYSYNLEEQIPDNQAKLIRSNGENVILDDNRAVLKYQQSGELLVNNDTLKPADESSSKAVAMNQLIIPFGKTSEIILPDGTKVFLNAGSRLVYPERFKGNTREVFLFGEGFFEVKHDADHPFIVQVNELRIKDLGTRFNVSAYPSDNRIETVLAEGKVSIKPNNAGFFEKATELVPGQLASYSRQTNQTLVKNVDVEDYILWTQRMMKFESVDLSRIVKKMERFYNIRFQFNDPMLGDLRISGKLELKDDRTEVIERIARTAAVKIINKGDGIYEILK